MAYNFYPPPALTYTTPQPTNQEALTNALQALSNALTNTSLQPPYQPPTPYQPHIQYQPPPMHTTNQHHQHTQYIYLRLRLPNSVEAEGGAEGGAGATPVEPEEEEAVPMATDQRVHTDTSTSGRHAHGGRDRGHHQQDGWNVHQDGRHQQHQQASQRWRGERGSGCRDITAYVL